MRSYLQRVAQSAQRPPRSVQPFVRSASPIAEQDQRLGMAGYEAADLISLAEPTAPLEVPPEAVHPSSPNTPERPPVTASTGDGMVQRKLASPSAEGLSASPAILGAAMAEGRSEAIAPAHPSAAPAPDVVSQNFLSVPTPVARPFPEMGQPPSGAPPWERPEQLPSPLLPSPLPGQAFPVQPDSVSDRDRQVLPPPEVPQPSMSAFLPEVPQPIERLQPEPPSGLVNSAPLSAEPIVRESVTVLPHPVRQPDADALPVLEPNLGIKLESATREGRSSQSDLPLGGPPVPAAPQVVIGRVNVEVVTPPASPSAAAKPGPQTAESVSVIGPLSGRLPTNLRLSLRGR
ncbi:hypothetical protein [Lyngbya confervoides]|uniref:Uncharacterized protein n=1 Tax=Lyngbya confervoides BDU141951 TaxID=1574623 RepID=A0ABD4T4J2_9CYAN|nr:hypothetical protein [Lyngbya confervoides]MCM1983260.1 hypothetical protein [Lyngbya confervoides BDU141951]